VNAVFVFAFFKELKLSSFDPALATTLGFNAPLMHYLLMTLVAVTSVASFESVGNILVVAMFVVPGAAALLVTDRLATMIQLSALFAAVGAIGGHLMAIIVPGWFGYRSTSTAGMMALAIGLIFTAAAIFAPLHGWLPRWRRRRSVARSILSEDIIAWLYRLEERGKPASVSIKSLCESLLASHWMTRRVIGREARAGRLMVSERGVSLTDQGRSRARELVRSHRLWETYLAKELDLPTDRIHDKAEKLEHVTDRDLRTRLDEATAASGRDPHGSLIPPEDEDA
jgi:manganese/zinc/iron transport system permease protein